jgi:hypothetical protein
VASRLANMGQGYRSDLQHSANLQFEGVSQTKAAELLNVSTRSVATANEVKKNAIPELIAAANHGAFLCLDAGNGCGCFFRSATKLQHFLFYPIKKPGFYSKPLFFMVPQGGFEPPACPLGGDRSILLSYRGKCSVILS